MCNVQHGSPLKEKQLDISSSFDFIFIHFLNIIFQLN